MAKYLTLLILSCLVVACSVVDNKGVNTSFTVSDAMIKPTNEFQDNISVMPLLDVQPEVYSLGDIEEGEAAIATFFVRNNHGVPVEIVDIQASCGCTSAEPDSYTIMPGSFTQLRVAVDTTAKQNDIKKSVFIVDSLGAKTTAFLNFNVVSNPHKKLKSDAAFKVKGIFDGQCASCHFEPLLHESAPTALFKKGCAMCHGEQARGAYAPKLAGYASLSSLKSIISQGVGKPQMPGFSQQHGGPLTDKQISDLAVWLAALPAE